MKTWFKNYKYTHEIFSCIWQFFPEYKLQGHPIKECRKFCNFEDIEIWEKLYYEPGGVGVYRSYSPVDNYIIIVFELFLNLPQSIELYNIENNFDSIITRLDSLNIKVINRI